MTTFLFAIPWSINPSNLCQTDDPEPAKVECVYSASVPQLLAERERSRRPRPLRCDSRTGSALFSPTSPSLALPASLSLSTCLSPPCTPSSACPAPTARAGMQPWGACSTCGATTAAERYLKSDRYASIAFLGSPSARRTPTIDISVSSTVKKAARTFTTTPPRPKCMRSHSLCPTAH
ncbi:hypothetical protein FA95DRAFT_1280330 [Auriscalpium vulgare]|uniref:Uncharacterized protein n=1 Tax=Auriscalpium vulgare TaxID=40419 RepID=A0ACB8R264_9AGAM|nr:hypothetical protein FA95DRAFT_1280330 [Auriscalpium vulgare]